MSPVIHSEIQNRLLAGMSAVDFQRLADSLEPVDLPRGFKISSADHVDEFTYFLQAGVGSVVLETPLGHKAEVCIFGREGMAPTTAVLGSPTAPFAIFMQIGGSGHRIPNAQLEAVLNDSVSVRHAFTRYIHTVLVQATFTAFCNANYEIGQRLARWILMCHDRIDGNDIPLTHEFLSVMLATRRQSVTTTLHLLEGQHLIASARSTISVRDRKGLEELAGEAYGIPEAEYEKLLGPFRKKKR